MAGSGLRVSPWMGLQACEQTNSSPASPGCSGSNQKLSGHSAATTHCFPVASCACGTHDTGSQAHQACCAHLPLQPRGSRPEQDDGVKPRYAQRPELRKRSPQTSRQLYVQG